MILLDHLIFDTTELERFGGLDLATFETMSTVVLVRNHPWDLVISIISRVPSWMPPPQALWQDYVLAHADKLMSLILRDKAELGNMNVQVTIGMTTYTFELKFKARPVRDVVQAPTPVSPSPETVVTQPSQVVAPQRPPQAPQQPRPPMPDLRRPVPPQAPQPPRAPVPPSRGNLSEQARRHNGR